MKSHRKQHRKLYVQALRRQIYYAEFNEESFFLLRQFNQLFVDQHLEKPNTSSNLFKYAEHRFPHSIYHLERINISNNNVIRDVVL